MKLGVKQTYQNYSFFLPKKNRSANLLIFFFYIGRASSFSFAAREDSVDAMVLGDLTRFSE